FPGPGNRNKSGQLLYVRLRNQRRVPRSARPDREPWYFQRVLDAWPAAAAGIRSDGEYLDTVLDCLAAGSRHSFERPRLVHFVQRRVPGHHLAILLDLAQSDRTSAECVRAIRRSRWHPAYVRREHIVPDLGSAFGTVRDDLLRRTVRPRR